MKLSSEGAAFIKREEGCRLDAYQDKARVWTIGYGDTWEVKPGMRITMEEADARFVRRIEHFEQGVLAAAKRPMTQRQFDALVSLAYNIGVAGLRTSTLMEHFNKNDLEATGREFGKWIFIRGKLKPLKSGMRGAEVAEWQRKVRDSGIACQVDGAFGPGTEKATREYQARQGAEEQVTPPGVGYVFEKEIDPVLVRRRFWEVVRFLT